MRNCWREHAVWQSRQVDFARKSLESVG